MPRIKYEHVAHVACVRSKSDSQRFGEHVKYHSLDSYTKNLRYNGVMDSCGQIPPSERIVRPS